MGPTGTTPTIGGGIATGTIAVITTIIITIIDDDDLSPKAAATPPPIPTNLQLFHLSRPPCGAGSVFGRLGP